MSDPVLEVSELICGYGDIVASANSDHPDHDRRAGDVYIVGKVLWQVTRARAGAAPRRSPRQPPPGRTSSPRTFCPP